MKVSPKIKMSLVFNCLGCFILILSIAGCASHRTFKLEEPAKQYKELNKYPIRIYLELSDAYINTTMKDKLGETKIGDDLARYTNTLAKQMFILTSNGNDVFDAILSPSVVSIDHRARMWAGSNSDVAITIKWTIRTKEGVVIWVKSITGKGEMEMGTAFSEGTRRKERVLLAIDNLFAETSKAITHSYELRTFTNLITTN